MYGLCKIIASWTRKVKFNQRGSVTIFISVIFFAMIILAGLFIDLARIKIAQNQLRRTINSSARSVMADYNADLRSSYGLFGTGRRDLDREFAKYMLANLTAARQQNLNLLDIRYETGSIILLQSLNSNQVVKRQILEAMKYKAPVEIGRELIDKFMQLRQAAAFFDEGNENRKSLNRINEKTKSLHEINQNIKNFGSELKNSKDEWNAVTRQIKSEKNTERIRELTKQREKLENQMNRMRHSIEGELHKAQRTGMEIELELKKIKGSGTPDIYKNNEQQDNQLSGSAQEEAIVRKEMENKVEAVEKSLQGVTAEIELTKKALQREKSSSNTENNIFSLMGLDSASKAYEQIKDYWNKNINQTAKEAEIRNYSEELQRKYPEVSSHFTVVPVSKSVIAFESSDSVKADNIAGFFRKIFGVINVKDNLISSRDEMYINEYILTYFSNSTTDSKGDVTYPYSKSESEYICFGNNALPKAISELYFTRFALDSVGYFAYSKGIPELTMRTIYSLVMGAIQASIDTVKLAVLKEPVPLVSVQPDNPLEKVTLTYKDHLRLFLLINPDERTKLDRVKELIKARSSIDPGDMYTNSAGTSTISIRMWFIPLAGLVNMEKGPFGTRISDGRCYITKQVEFGY